MASKLLGYALGVPIYLARQIRVKGYLVAVRLIEAIPQSEIDKAAQNVAAAMEGDKLFTEDMKSKIKEAEVTSMPHTTPMDPHEHYTVRFALTDGSHAIGHVAMDPDKQEAAR